MKKMCTNDHKLLLVLLCFLGALLLISQEASCYPLEQTDSHKEIDGNATVVNGTSQESHGSLVEEEAVGEKVEGQVEKDLKVSVDKDTSGENKLAGGDKEETPLVQENYLVSNTSEISKSQFDEKTNASLATKEEEKTDDKNEGEGEERSKERENGEQGTEEKKVEETEREGNDKVETIVNEKEAEAIKAVSLYTSPSPRDS